MTEDIEFVVTQEDDGRYLRDVLRKRLGVSRGFLRRLANRGMAEVAGAPRMLRDRVQAGEHVRLSQGSKDGGVVPEALPLDVVYTDNDLLVVNKQAGMVVHPVHQYTSGTLANAVAYYLAPDKDFVTVRPVHRLDAGTSGLIVFAKHAHAHAVLHRDMDRRQFRRWYIALVAGRMPNSSGEINAPIARMPDHPVKRAVDPQGQPARTLYQVVQSWPEFTLIEAELLTGRTHQVRVHMAHTGHPLVGDDLYGGPHLMSRPALHSARLQLCQPLSRETLSLDQPVPDDMRALIT